MRALVFDGSLRLDTDVPAPLPNAGEALIRVRMAGICGTDLEVVEGYRGFRGILGHEFVGDVISSPDPKWLGQRICGEINAWCGTCDSCARGLFSHCLRRTVLGIEGRDGAFAEFLTLPAVNLHAVPHSVSDEEAVMTEPLAAAFRILRQVSISARDRVVVLGDGRLGLLCAQVLAATGCDLTLVGKHDAKLEIARRLGLKVARRDEVPHGVDVVVEATGSPSGMTTALHALRPQGTLILKSTMAQAGEVDLSPIAIKELTVVGSRCGPFDRALDALSSGSVRVRDMITATFPLDEGIRAFRRAGDTDTLKVLLDMRGDPAHVD